MAIVATVSSRDGVSRFASTEAPALSRLESSDYFRDAGLPPSYSGLMRAGSVLSFLDRGPWGNSLYRGNCSGYVYREIFERLKPRVFTDPMVGGGTSTDVAWEMGIEGHGLDLHSGFNVLKDSIREAVGKSSDLVLSHPPYHDIVVYSGKVWGRAPHPDDLSRCASEEEFLDKLTHAIKNQREATRGRGYYGVIIGDVRKGGNYSSYQADLIARMPKTELQAVLIKQQHHVMSDSKDYPLKLPRIMHEYVILWERRWNVSVAQPRNEFANEKPAFVTHCAKPRTPSP
jgi:hypothetical protein